uniref:Ankyrin repeat domain-containing protein n=1 Tax=Peronospora matthiolae TaxID=2874970 RepID=A0AAV1TJ66_9STRA
MSYSRPPPPPLHLAIWDGDVARVRSLLNSVCPESADCCESDQIQKLKTSLEMKDVRGYTALHLALRIVQPNQLAIVKLLLDRNANVTSRNLDGWSCMHDATLCNDEYLLAQLYLQGEKQLMQSLASSQETFMQALEQLPDFEADIFLEAQSWVPMVSSVLPSDTIRVWKRGSQLRVDWTLKGLDGLKWTKGAMSHVFLGRNGGQRAGHAVVINHESQQFYDVLEAMHNSSVGNMDLALQVMLTTAMSSSRLISTKLRFVEQKKAKARGEGDEKALIDHDKEKEKSRSQQRKCPWSGTTYKIRDLAIEAQFRPTVNPSRKLKQLPAHKDVPFDEVQQFVNHLRMAVPHGTDEKSSTWQNRRSSSGSECEDSPQMLRLEKGRILEMHLDVIAGDTVRWKFLSKKSNDFCFVATIIHEDDQQHVCRTDGVKNMEIAGAYEVDRSGKFVLMWQNTQKGFTIDRNGFVIDYNVAHIRSAVDRSSVGVLANIDTSGSHMSANSSESRGDTQIKNVSFSRLTDEQKCEFFRRLDHVPNPITTTTAFVDHFKLGVDSSEPDIFQGKKLKQSILNMFEYKTQCRPQASNNFVSRNETINSVFEIKSDFRSMTALPPTHRVRKNFEAKVVMAETFPFQPQDFLPIIQFISTTGDHVKNLEEFFQMGLPPGFPVKFELPVLFTIRIAYTFRKITLNAQLDPKLFDVPENYDEVFTLDEVRS